MFRWNKSARVMWFFEEYIVSRSTSVQAVCCSDNRDYLKNTFFGEAGVSSNGVRPNNASNGEDAPFRELQPCCRSSSSVFAILRFSCLLCLREQPKISTPRMLGVRQFFTSQRSVSCSKSYQSGLDVFRCCTTSTSSHLSRACDP